jgi:hypothetical protein
MYGVFVVLGGAKFGFSWVVAVSLRKPPIMGVGFPWISLDSLVRIETFQWVTRDKRWKSFSRRRVAFEPPQRRRLSLHGGQDCASGKPNPVSDF